MRYLLVFYARLFGRCHICGRPIGFFDELVWDGEVSHKRCLDFQRHRRRGRSVTGAAFERLVEKMRRRNGHGRRK